MAGNLKRSEHELKRLLEEAIEDEFGLSKRGLWFCIDRVEAQGRPIGGIKVWATLHFLPAGSPFCCGEPGCHLPQWDEERLSRLSDRMRHAMKLTQGVRVGFGEQIRVNYHDGVVFTRSP
jgi:hypothetical protein